MFQIVIIAGGLATRLYPITKSIPKSLIEINNKPFIYHQLKLLESHGFKKILFCLGKYGENIRDYLNSENFNINFTFSFDGNEQLGTGGALKNAQEYLDEDFFVLYGDSFLTVNYKKMQEYYIQNNNHPLMSVLKNNNKWDKSNVDFSSNKITLYNKKVSDLNLEYIDYGVSILPKKILKNYNAQKFDLAEIYSDLVYKKNLYGFEVYTRFYEIGSKKGIKDTSKFLIKYIYESN